VRAEANAVAEVQPRVPAPAAAQQETFAPSAIVSSQEPSADLQGLWSKLLEAVGRASPFTRTYLLEAHPVSFNKNVFMIGFDPEFEDHIGLVDNARNHTLLQTKLHELGHSNAQIKFVKADSPALRPAIAPEAVAAASPAPAKPAASIATAKSATVVPGTAAVKEKLASVPFNKDDFKNDPLIAKALEIFKGQIVEVRA
jgi:hypothetical protein